MRLKLFSAPSLDEAMVMIRAELGEDAIVLSERITDDGIVEVRAAVERPTTARFKTPIFDQAPRPTLATNRLRERMREVLVWHGAPDGFAQIVANSGVQLAGHDSSDASAGLTAALEGVVGFSPLPGMPEKPIILVGPPGAGKTATTAKLTRRASAAKGELDPICADFDATLSAAQLSAFMQLPTTNILTAMTPAELSELMVTQKQANRISVVDTPPINPFDTEDLERLRDLLRMIDAEPVLVISAEGHPADLEEAARSFAALGIRRCILTKLDAVRRRGGAISALVSARLNLSHLAITPFIGGGLIPATPNRLAKLLLDEAPGAEALKGAA